jgi:carbon-monoxide dehydrogenase medium subunit
MWPAPFDYHAARSADEAVELLGRLPGAAVLAGGLSLVPAMRRRRLSPPHVVDINPASDLATIDVRADTVSVGATCRQEDLLRLARRTGAAPLLADALAHTGTRQTRQRGTVAGIVATGNPATQLAAVCSVLEVRARLRDTTGDRSVAVAGLLTGAPVTGALLSTVDFPAWVAGDGHAFLQTGRRVVGATVAGVAARVRLAGDGRCVRADVAPFLAGHDGGRLPEVADRLVGDTLDDGDVAEAADLAATAVGAATDALASAEYRRHVVRVLVRRALVLARSRARRTGR